MKNLFFILCASCFLISCGGMTRAISGTTEKNLLGQVAVETGCGVESIKVIDKVQTTGNATYSLDVCGERMVYRQVGSVFMEAKEVDNLFKQ